jgi:hypothetical protein
LPPAPTSLLGGLQFLSAEDGENRLDKLTLLAAGCSADNDSFK